MTYREESRRDADAAAERRRADERAREELRAIRQREADERAARLRQQARQEKAQRRADRKARQAERAAALTPEHIYRRGTLALVLASGLASLPAQIAHFVGISWMLLPVPLAIEGAAWVLAAGVAYADERELPGWVRWLLRGLVLAAAAFAAAINYGYGTHLPGLTIGQAQAAGLGLAAVSLLGPFLFEIRQWVSTLGAGDADDRARRRHARRRHRHHRAVAKIAVRLISAAPYGELSTEDAWARAWEIVKGTTEPGMTPALYRRAVRSAAAALAAQQPTPARRPGRRTLPASAPVSICDGGSVLPLPAPSPAPAPAPVPVTAVSTMTPQVDETAPLRSVPAPAETDTPGGRLDAKAARAAIEAAWEAGDTIREAAAKATRSASYVGAVYAQLTKARGPQPSKGQTRIGEAA